MDKGGRLRLAALCLIRIFPVQGKRADKRRILKPFSWICMNSCGSSFLFGSDLTDLQKSKWTAETCQDWKREGQRPSLPGGRKRITGQIPLHSTGYWRIGSGWKLKCPFLRKYTNIYLILYKKFGFFSLRRKQEVQKRVLRTNSALLKENTLLHEKM